MNDQIREDASIDFSEYCDKILPHITEFQETLRQNPDATASGSLVASAIHGLFLAHGEARYTLNQQNLQLKVVQKHGAKIKNHTETLSEHTRDISEHAESLLEQNTALAEQQGIMTQYETHIAALQEEVEKLNTTVQEMETASIKKDQKLRELEKRLGQFSNECVEFEQEVKGLKKELKAQKKNKDTVTTEQVTKMISEAMAKASAQQAAKIIPSIETRRPRSIFSRRETPASESNNNDDRGSDASDSSSSFDFGRSCSSDSSSSGISCEKFTGTGTPSFEEWSILIECKLILERIYREKDRINIIFCLTGGRAQKSLTPRMDPTNADRFRTSEEMLEYLWSVYKDPLKEEKTRGRSKW